MSKILVDINVILDAVLNRNKISKELVDRLVNSYNELFITSSMVATLDYFLNKYKVDKKKFKKELLTKFKIVTTSGMDASKALDFEDGEDALIVLSFKRIANDGIIISNDKDFPSMGLPVLTPDEALKKKELFESSSFSGTVPMLDLPMEYRSMMEKIDEAVLKCMSKAKYILGDEVKELETKVAQYIGTKYAVGVSSGTDALVLSLRALAIKNTGKEFWDKEDLIITTPFTFTATGEAILRAGATPLFVDIDLETYTIDPELIEKAVKKYGRKVKGIIPVHLYGHPANMDEIMKIARENDLFVVEDCAQSFGARWDGKQTGSFGDTGCFSFFPSKNLGGFGDGGMVTTNDDELYELLLMLRKHGGKDKYNVDYIGYNARLDTIQAAILLAKFKYIDEFNKRRRKIANNYSEKLKDLNWIEIPFEHSKAHHVYHQYTVRVLNRNRDDVQKKLKENGISSMVYYPIPLHKMKVFINSSMEISESLKNSELASQSVLSLPIEPLIREFQISKILETLREI
ncbi:dTDP-4-amino-4,6-dideoxygalactose transaminase [Balnearium lithotrophicum]|uniref:dTDP-4-amino-4,6-dideoxygalactose transaminase n=1 Tax=Balnearium lithotrophicum TaxID=223788 RepID=A0A521C888_9BACT|nr:DegT/DnrJ/EryC1/StrS family aminotransferase [Balnearium lithotrophicum]SMO55707.1 dTDP-4-amino-4,6-dideoxygalactose transaminase [Balnearium lithotrophicum]